MSKRGKIAAAIGALVVVGAVAAVLVSTGSRGTPVEVAEATRGDLTVTVAASGSVSAHTKADVYPPTAGVLASIEVTEGQRVTAGQVIAVMDTAPIEAQLAQAEAAYQGALAQRAAAARTVPSAQDRAAAQAAVDAAWSAYQAALAQYQAAQAGLGAPTASDLANAQAAVAVAEALADAADAAYESFHTNVYLPAPEPRDPALESALAALTLAREQAAANLVTAQQTLAALQAAADNEAAIAAARVAKDQAYAAYLGAVSQRDQLAKAASVSAALASADAAVEAAEKAKDLAAGTLEKATLKAPIDGVVVFNTLSGAILGGPVIKATAGSSVSPAAAPFSVVAFDELTFTAQVDEADIDKVEAGMPAVVTLDALPDVEFETTVDRVEQQSVLTPTGGTAFPVTMRLRAGTDRLLLGMNGSVEIKVETIPDTVTVPVEAILEEADATYVYVVRDGRAHYQQVTVGRLTDTRAQVLSGVAEGEQVVVSGVSGLEDGAPVKVR